MKLHGYTNTKTLEFVHIAIQNFLEATQDHRPEGLLPKLALFAATIDEVTKELRPAVEKVLARYNIPASRILVNVGDDKLTTNDDIREFNRLDTPQSEKQYILLVNKGREGWNCRSLFGVALFREPKSKVFVLQATMRCLRSIGEVQHTGQVYLTQENLAILNDELQQNFRISAEELQKAGDNRKHVKIKVTEPPVKITLRHVRRSFEIEEKVFVPGVKLELDNIDRDRYRIIHTLQDGLDATDTSRKAPDTSEDLSHLRLRTLFSGMTLVAEIARYLNRSPLEIEEILEQTFERLDGILAAVNEFNEILYDYVIPRLFQTLYDLTPNEKTEEHEVELVKIPANGYYEISAKEDLIVSLAEPGMQTYKEKSFHLDTYCFDSKPEKELFWNLLRQGKIKKVYFTGMLTHGQSDFYIQYIDPESHTVRSYYPDFVYQKEDNTYVIVEVKGDNMIDDPVVQAKKEFALQVAGANGMEYQVVKGSEVGDGNYRVM